MPFINVIDENEAEGKLADIYNNMISKRGKLSNIMKIHSLIPDSMQSHMDLYISIMFNRSKLKRDEKEFIAVIVSALNKCEYCINHHGEALKFYWKDDKLINDVVNDYRNSEISDRLRLIGDYVYKVTLESDSVSEDDIALLSSAGFSDEDILSVNLIASYFNFVNRIANGLGVEFTEEEMQGYKY